MVQLLEISSLSYPAEELHPVRSEKGRGRNREFRSQNSEGEAKKTVCLIIGRGDS